MSILFINSGSTNSITEKGPRTSQKLSMTHTTLQRVDEKKKELTKNTKNILAPSNTLQNTSINSGSKNIDSKTSINPLMKDHKPLNKLEETRGGATTPTQKGQPRKTIPNSASASNLQRSVSEAKKGLEFYCFMPSIK